jgi:ABC-type sugar transport system substrate-binding protein
MAAGTGTGDGQYQIAASAATQTNEPRATRERNVKSVQHAMDILDLLAGPLRASGVTGVAAALGMNVSTAHHLLRTLQARGLVEQDPESKLYRLGVRTVALGDAYLSEPPAVPGRLRMRSVAAAADSGPVGGFTVPAALAKAAYRIVFIQYQPHAVAAAWSQGIQDVAAAQPQVDYQLLDGEARVDTQIALMHRAINQGVAAIFLQPVDSLAVGPSIKTAREAGVPVITLNIDSTEQHATHVAMNHYEGGVEIGKKMGELMRGTGNVVILNAPCGILIREQRTNGFKDGLKQYPRINIVADESADWNRNRAREVLSAILASNSNIQGVFGVNDSMALGAVDALKGKGLLGKVVVFGDDGEKDALSSIEAGELTGTQYTDVYQQGRFAASLAIAAATSGASAPYFRGHVLMPYSIVTRENVDRIQPNQRW